MTVYNFTVLKTSKKGALLITDGKKIAWVQRRAQRKDGTFGDGARRWLNESKIECSTLDDFKVFNDKIVSVVETWAPECETDKAWLIWGVWYPKSLCTLVKQDDIQALTISILGAR